MRACARVRAHVYVCALCDFVDSYDEVKKGRMSDIRSNISFLVIHLHFVLRIAQ